MRIAFFGTPEFAVPTLHRLLESSHEVVAVVTQPDRRRGRGQRVSASPIKQLADAHGLRTLQPERMQDTSFVDALTDARPEVGVVAAYGKMLPETLLSLPRYGMINVHASLLPKYRGAAPIHRAVMSGETETGITIIQLILAMDAGPMLRWAPYPIEPNERSDRLEQALANLGAELLVDVVADIQVGRAVPHPQDHSSATFAPRLHRDDGIIDWNASAETIHNQVRGLHPWPHAFTHLDRTRYMFLKTTVLPCPEHLRAMRRSKGGTVLEVVGDQLVIATGDPTTRAQDDRVLTVHELQVEGRKPMATRAFLAGRSLASGDVFQSNA